MGSVQLHKLPCEIPFTALPIPNDAVFNPQWSVDATDSYAGGLGNFNDNNTQCTFYLSTMNPGTVITVKITAGGFSDTVTLLSPPSAMGINVSAGDITYG